MATNERIISATIADDGSTHYTSVTSAPDDSTAVCYMIPDRIIPVIFVPGIMGTNLKAVSGTDKDNPVWLVDSAASVAGSWMWRGPEIRKKKLDPKNTVVYEDGKIPSGTAQSETELRRRGWGTVGNRSYGKFLLMLENALNDASECKTGLRAQLMHKLVATAPGVSVLLHDEVDLSYRYQLPVHAVGYNWLQSNADSAKHLADKIKEFKDHYTKLRKTCDKVILVTHSMGGLVARYYSEVDGHRDSVLGIVHGVMPTTGSATAYKRVKVGTEGAVGLALGPDAATMIAVFAQAPGALQLLPSVEYWMGWLKIKDGGSLVSKPLADPYAEIYLQRGKWWAPVNDKLINPLDPAKKGIDADWMSFAGLINNEVQPFHEAMRGKFHSTTYAFYGDDEQHKTWGDVVWKRTISPGGLVATPDQSPLSGLMDKQPIQDSGTGTQTFDNRVNQWHTHEEFVLQDASEHGDGTVPMRSGRAPSQQPGVKACVPYPKVDHEGAYKEKPQQLFALWAITRIVMNVKGTSLEYKQ
ncbi:esterase/lipase family protein [Paraburkholderia sp. MM6662-R1]|uniref:esterase/lipase family protein n=1 Tax=Paraburkholderia sp. MM6662-R1 TaxID=2991066 RepID=UPI003D19D982